MGHANKHREKNPKCNLENGGRGNRHTKPLYALSQEIRRKRRRKLNNTKISASIDLRCRGYYVGGKTYIFYFV